MFKMIETKISKRKFIESKNKNFNDSENSIKRTKKTSGFTMKRRDIMSEISINRFNSKSLRFVFKARPHKWRQKKSRGSNPSQKAKKTGKHLFSLHRANDNQTERPKRLSAR